ncbi:MAG: thiopeptide-type bacteriocin biosynthesis protein [Acidimicrobiales bacterium]
MTQPAYEPEYERYGGPEGLAVSETAFGLSSRLVASLMNRPDFDRFAVASTIIDGTLRALVDRDVDPGPWLRRYLFVWHSIRPETRDQATAMIRTELLDNPRVADRPDMSSAPTGLASTWASIVDRLLQSLDRLGIGTDDYGGPEILVSHVHMALNRLGLSIQEECQLLVRGLPTTRRPGPSSDAGRDLWAGSSFDEWRPPSPPGHLSPISRLTGEDAAAGVPGSTWAELTELHLPGSGPGGLLAAVAGRRSAEAWESGIDVSDLDQLLRITHGPVERGVFDGGTFVVDWAKRGYPSAGMSFPVFARVAVGDVDGLDPGLYEYEPIMSRLVPVYPNGGLGLSLLSCGWFLPDDLRTRPAAVIWLCCDLARIRPRYELRALRFALIEVGHVAQNLLLGAAALDLACRPVGGFFDETACLAAGVDGGDELPAYAICVGGSPSTTKGVDK